MKICIDISKKRALDAAKMNRAICLMRPEPKEADLQSTGEAIVHASPQEMATVVVQPPSVTSGSASGDGGDDDMPPPPPPKLIKQSSTSIPSANLSAVLGPLASSYHSVYSRQQKIAGGRDFVGMRDYYAMLKMLRVSILNTAKQSQAVINRNALDNAIYRNFGGKPLLLEATVRIFRNRCYSNNGHHYEDELDAKAWSMNSHQRADIYSSKPPTLQLIHENLKDNSARHLMVLTRQGAALALLLNQGTVSLSESVVLVGSDFEEDRAELRLVQQINQVKRAMASGKVGAHRHE